MERGEERSGEGVWGWGRGVKRGVERVKQKDGEGTGVVR